METENRHKESTASGTPYDKEMEDILMNKKIVIALLIAASLSVAACSKPVAGTSGESVISNDVKEETEHIELNRPEVEDETEVKPEDNTKAEEENTEENTGAEEESAAETEEYYYGDYSELFEGDRAPWFSADLVDGSSFDMKDVQGKVILVNFWATWCGPCVREMPAFEWLYADYGTDSDVAIIAVNCMDPKSDVDSFVSENGYTFPIAYDIDGSIEDQYPTDGIPYTLVIGKDGYIKKIYLGAYDAESQYKEYKQAIEDALSE